MPVNTYNHIFTKGPESALPATFDEGKIRFTVDTGRLFVDGQNGRTEISDFIKGMTEAEIKAQLAPLANKIYISSDTNKFMIYDNSVTGNWINIANSGQAQHADEADEATHASTADYATNSGTATYATNAGTSIEANHATNASTSTYATNAGTAVHASTADYATNAGTAAYVTNGVRSIATGTANGTINVNINGSTANIAVKGLGDRAFDSTTYVPTAGGGMTGPLIMNTNTSGNYREGIRINKDAANGGYSTLSIGASNGSTAGTEDGAFWIGTHFSLHPRKLFISHNGSDHETFFYASSADDHSPSLQLGGELKIGGNNGPTLRYNSATQSIDFIFV